MKKKQYINFSIFELIKDDQHPSCEDIRLMIEGRDSYNDDDNVYSLSTIQEDGIYWICFEYGATSPRPKKVIDTSKNNRMVDNPRSKNQAEPNKQLFCAYSEKEGNIYVSNSQKKTFIEKFFNDLSQDSSVCVKRILIEPEDFLKQLKKISRVTIVGKPDLFSAGGDLFRATEDIFGLGAPNQFHIIADFGDGVLEKAMLTFQNFLKRFNNREIQKFICVGKDDKNIDIVFNTETFNKKISISLRKQEDGLFKKSEVHDSLISVLRKNIKERNTNV